MRVMVRKEERVRACSSKMAKPELVLRVLCRMRVARGSGKW